MTTDTYNRSAAELAEFFRGIGPRDYDIDLAFGLAGEPENPRVLEIGCGDGRDAQVILKRTNNYTGVDVSEGMIDLARQTVPDGHFEIADIANYEFPPNLDIVFAFASLLHLEPVDIENVFIKLEHAVKLGGVVYISLKYASEYREEVKSDKFGKRLFYFYHPRMIDELAGPAFRVVHQQAETRGNTDWFEIALTHV